MAARRWWVGASASQDAAARRTGPRGVPGCRMAGQARDLRMTTGCESSVDHHGSCLPALLLLLRPIGAAGLATVVSPKAMAVALGRRRAADRDAQAGTDGGETLEPRPGGQALEDLAGLNESRLG